MSEILLLSAHPDLSQSRIAHTLLAAARACGGAEKIELRDLYRLYPDYAIDVAAEQAALARSRLIVLLHPLHWYSMPALQKLWIDEVLRFGWAYGPGGEALRGKDLWLVTSTGGSAASYGPAGHNEHPLDAYLLPYAQTARYCGMRFLPPLVLHDAHRLADEDLDKHAKRFAHQLRDYPAWLANEPRPSMVEVPLDDRPALFSPLSGGDD
jgi:glutathione-regulated potassium-efflux system ancillary protein KefF